MVATWCKRNQTNTRNVNGTNRHKPFLRHIATCDQIQMLSWGNLKPHCPLGKLVQHFEELQAAKWPVGAHKLLFPAKISNIATSAPRSPHIPKLASRSSHRSQVSHWSWVRPKSEQCELLRHSTGMFSLPQTHRALISNLCDIWCQCLQIFLDIEPVPVHTSPFHPKMQL